MSCQYYVKGGKKGGEVRATRVTSLSLAKISRQALRVDAATNVCGSSEWDIANEYQISIAYNYYISYLQWISI